MKTRTTNRKVLLTLGFSLALCTICPRSWAQYSIPWSMIGSGGGTSSGGSYRLSGSLGQLEASGRMNGGSYSLTGGFWVIDFQQTPGAPTLSLNISQVNNLVSVSWQNVSGWSLQQNPDAGTTNWTVNSSWTTSNGTNYLNLISPPGKMFYRLMKQ
jgi:hypothetical protein